MVAVGTGVTPREASPGQRVMDHHYTGCGSCKHCRSGWAQMCLEDAIVFGASGNGAHAKYMKVPVDTLLPLPDALSFETGAAISCGTGTAYGALKRLNLPLAEKSTALREAIPAASRNLCLLDKRVQRFDRRFPALYRDKKAD